MLKLTFLGGTGTVTGSKYLVEGGGTRVLVDCGLFQGVKELRLRNWDAPPVHPGTLDAVVLTHAHLDHTGYLPRLVQAGFRGPVWCTGGTRALAGILLPDSGHLQEEDANYANHRGFSRHKPALPLYTEQDARAALALFRSVAFDEVLQIGALRVTFTPVGHLLGAASIRIDDGTTSVVFTGDVGRPDDVLLSPPRPLLGVQNLVIESTYGDRLHEGGDPADQLADVVSRVVARGGVVLVPAFAVGRAQQLLLLLGRLKAAGRIPNVPVFLNSPMAIDATRIFSAHPEEHRLSVDEVVALNKVATNVHTAEESKQLNERKDPMVLLAGSGMATGGRILHHLKAFGPDPRAAILLVGFQAPGTRGEALEHGVESLKIHGEYVPIRAERVRIGGLSGHADYQEMGEWLRSVTPEPRRVFITHGEPAASEALRRHLGQTLGWDARVPRHGDTVELT